MAAHLVRLKITLLRNQLRGNTGQVLGLVLSVVFGLMMAAGVVAGLVYLRGLPAAEAGVWVTALGAVLVLGWALSPLGNVGGDETLDPARFVTFAVPRRQLITGLLAGSMVSVPAVVTAVAALGTVAVWSRGVLPAVVALLAGVIGFVTCVVAARATGTVLAVLGSRRRSREVIVSVGLLLVLGVSFVPLLISEGAVRLGADELAPVARVVALTPLGWVWSAPWDAAHGAVVGAVVKLVLAAALIPLLMRLWGVMLERHLVRPPVSGRATARRGRTVLAGVRGPTGAVAERCLKYWSRDPRYTLSLLMLFLFPVLMLASVPLGWMSLQTWALVVAPVIAYVVGWGLHNDIAYDADPWWLHVATHVPGWADRAGRVIASAVWALPVVVAAAVGGALFAGRPGMLPALVGLSLAVAGAGYGVSSVSAVIAPYWAPAPGENPNATPPGVGAQMFVAQLVTGAATLVAAAPLLAPFVRAWQGSTTASWMCLVAGSGVGAALTVAGVVIGGRILDRRGPELLATVRK